MAPRVQRQRRMLPGKLVVFQREPRKKRATHANLSRTHTLAKTGNFWFCWRCGFCTAQREKRARGTVSRSRAQPGRSAQEAQGWQKPKERTLAGGASLACCCGRAATETGWDWRDVVSATSLAWISLKRDTNLACHCSARTCASFVGLLVADAVSLIRTSSQKQIHRWTCMMLSGAELGDLKDNLARSGMT